MPEEAGGGDRAGFEHQRSLMLERDLKGRGIRDERVLAAMAAIPREIFVDPGRRAEAYADHPLPIGSGQTISQPYMVALMSECLELAGPEKVLEIGTGSGYQAAILARLAREVYTIERLPELAERAKATLRQLGCSNMHFRVGDGSLGWPEAAPFDRIIVTCAAPAVTEALKEQLADDGVLIIPVGHGWQRLLSVRRDRAGAWSEREVTTCVFVPLIGRQGFPE